MKLINDFELQTLLGGWANPEGCKKVQEMVPQMGKDPDADWEGWLDAFDRECLGIFSQTSTFLLNEGGMYQLHWDWILTRKCRP